MGKLILIFGLVYATSTQTVTTENFSKSEEELKKGSAHLLYLVEEGDDVEVAAHAIYRVVIVDDKTSAQKTNERKLWELPPANIKWNIDEQSDEKNSKELTKKKD